MDFARSDVQRIHTQVHKYRYVQSTCLVLSKIKTTKRNQRKYRLHMSHGWQKVASRILMGSNMSCRNDAEKHSANQVVSFFLHPSEQTHRARISRAQARARRRPWPNLGLCPFTCTTSVCAQEGEGEEHDKSFPGFASSFASSLRGGGRGGGGGHESVIRRN